MFLYSPIGPGPKEYRENLLNMFKLDKKLFALTERKFAKKYHAVYQEVFLAKNDYEGTEIETIYETLDEKWLKFIENDYLRIEKHIANNWK